MIYSNDMYCSSTKVFRRVGLIFYLLNEKRFTEEGNKKEDLVSPLSQKSGELDTSVVASELD